MTQRSLLRLLLLGVLLLLLLLAWQLRESHETAVRRVTDDAGNLAHTLDGQLTSTLQRIESNLNNIAGQLPVVALSQQAAPRYRQRIDALLRPYSASFPEVSGYYVWDAAGDLLYDPTSAFPLQGRRSIAHRPGYQELRADPKAALAFSDSIRSFMTGQQTVAVYVPVRDAGGSLQAVVTATLNLDRIGRIFQALQVPRGSVIFVRRSDSHQLLIRYPHLEGEINKPVRNAIQQRIDAGEPGGRDRFRAVTDGEYRIYGFRKLEGYPFYVVVGLAESGALATWRQNAEVVAVALVVLGLALLAAIWQVSRLEQQRQAAQGKAQQAHDLLQEAINSISAGIIIYDPQDRLVMCNMAQQQMFAPIQDILRAGRSFEEITHEGMRRGLFVEAGQQGQGWLDRRLQQHAAANGEPHELELANGTWIQFSEHRTPQGYTVGSRIDITDRKRLEAELREQASTDSLTGLPNRRQFMGRLEEELERVRRQTTREACVLMLDLDHFKRVNDQYGHAAGDSILRHFASLLRHELRAADIAGRMGGEEFAVILPGTGMQASVGFAQRFCERLAGRPLNFGAQQIHVSVSVGIAAINVDDLSPDAVLSRADAALYRAKDGGRNRVELATAA